MRTWWPVGLAALVQFGLLIVAFGFWSSWAATCPHHKSDCIKDGQSYAGVLSLMLSAALIVGAIAASVVLEVAWVDVPGRRVAGVTATAVVAYYFLSWATFRGLSEHGDLLDARAGNSRTETLLLAVPILIVASSRTRDR